mmetsp:Transcript_34143/g.78735  ORF Transcript_34143/g.78735 Transcript_34143/m.78735 type:complete len:129 (-) Transcript_34143:297-683(-)
MIRAIVAALAIVSATAFTSPHVDTARPKTAVGIYSWELSKEPLELGPREQILSERRSRIADSLRSLDAYCAAPSEEFRLISREISQEEKQIRMEMEKLKGEIEELKALKAAKLAKKAKAEEKAEEEVG